MNSEAAPEVPSTDAPEAPATPINAADDAPAGLPPEVLANLMKPMQPQERSIYEPHQRIDGEGRQITEMIQLHGPVVPGAVRFVAHGQAHLKVKRPNPTGGPAVEAMQAIPINVILKDARDIMHAFEIYDESIQSAAKAQVDQMKSEHVRASLADTGGIRIPGRRGG